MKKFFLIIAALVSAVSVRADEGMWLLPMLQRFNADAMRNIGSRLTPEDIYSINSTSLKDAIVQFGGGCTGEIISPEGLLVTNHHCGYASIQQLSTTEHNYLEDGFFATSKEMEIPVPGLTVKFMRSMTDVTDLISPLSGKKKEKTIKEMEDAASAEIAGGVARVTSFYNDNVYYLIVYQIYKDVRFVAAPPAAMGKFGGETDNWMWPRHTCDFSMFRVYADENNNPAEYAAGNRPFVPRRFLKVSLSGVSEGDFALVMGYPGRTQRFQTAVQLKQMMACNGLRVEARTVRQKVMKEGMEQSPEIRLKYANKYAGSANGWKKWQGEALAFEKLRIIPREEEKEAAFMEWVNADPARVKAYGKAIAGIDKSVEASGEAELALTLLSETIARTELPGIVLGLKGVREEDYDRELDRRMALAMFDFYARNVKDKDRIKIKGHKLTPDGAAEYVEWLFANPTEENINDFIKAVESKGMSLYTVVKKAVDGSRESSRAFTAGLLEWKKDEPSYPDANSTMRFTYGNVKPYSPKDGMQYWHYTTLAGVLEKEDPSNYEFRVPAKVKELALANDYGRYADADGKLHTCFLTTNDITGGNSGSPVLDADGNLIGLAFDGNWESMSSDVCFEPDLQRCICVDIRYVLWMVGKVGGAENIINELSFAK